MKVGIPYNFGDTVYLKNDEWQREYIIVAFILYAQQLLQIRISDGGCHYDVYEFEISLEKDADKAAKTKDDEED